MNKNITTSDQLKIICVDKGRELAQQVVRLFPRNLVECDYERSLDAVIDRFEKKSFDLMLFSSSVTHQQPSDALEVLELISAKCPNTQILFFAQPAKIKIANQALRAGVFHYSHLPIEDEELRLLIESAMDRKPQLGPNLLLRSEVEKTTFETLTGNSSAMQEVYRQIRQAAATDIPILLMGETGTGKELVARAVHELSHRSQQPYVPVHIGSVPAELVASELFGHEKGAYTGAETQRCGCFEEADTGTVFLDEIATIDDKMQISLLRLLETSQFSRIGGQDTIHVNVRVIAATNADLMREIRSGTFREDLYYRLDVLRIVLPPLRKRHGDITLLIKHFIKDACDNFQKEVRGISPDCMTCLEGYEWPGNVRELKNVIQRAVVVCDSDVIDTHHLPKRLLRFRKENAAISFQVGTSLKDIEKETIARTLDYTSGNRTRTSQLLGVSRRTLYNKMHQYGLN